jgi:cellulose synthase/poly-beta-1,6-N-acetylglucosamine synthase-like glycosyltransferase
MAHNEEANIAHTLRAVLAQRSPAVDIQEIIVVASGCTDRTVAIVETLAREEPRLRLCLQAKREGKASAINLFFQQARGQILILLGADVIPAEQAFEHLCAPFQHAAIGMVGGRPVPVNDPDTFMGHAVHLLWYLHDRIARQSPKLGEIVALRPIISAIPSTSAVDEISIQALITQSGYQLVYQPACLVYNKGPLTVRDFLKQRRRIYAGHLNILRQHHYAASTMSLLPILRQLYAARCSILRSPRRVCWTLGAIALEICARLLGYYDHWRRREHFIWPMVVSTKNLEVHERYWY